MANRIQSTSMVLIVLLMSTIPVVHAAEEQDSIAEQTKLIRIKKIANEWQGAILTLHTRGGEEIKGRLIEVSNNKFHLQVGKGFTEIPLVDVVQVSFEPGFPEIMLTFASAVMGSGFLGGAMKLIKVDANSNEVSIAAFVGLLGGGLWGYSTFYESEVIHLE